MNNQLIRVEKLTDWDMMRSRMSWEVAVEAKEKVLPESLAVSSSSPALFSGMGGAAAWAALVLTTNAEGLEGVRALDTWRAEALHDLDRNSMGPLGLSGSWSSPFGPFSAHNKSILLLLLLYMWLLMWEVSLWHTELMVAMLMGNRWAAFVKYIFAWIFVCVL